MLRVLYLFPNDTPVIEYPDDDTPIDALRQRAKYHGAVMFWPQEVSDDLDTGSGGVPADHGMGVGAVRGGEG